MRSTRRLLAVFAMVALISAGCSNAPAGAAADSSGSNNTAASALAATGSSGGNNIATAHDSSPSPLPATPASQGGASVSNGGATRQQAVKFAECMRANGVTQFPDPDASGQLTIDAIANGSSLDTNSVAFKQAIGACKDLEPPGFTGGPRSPEQQKAALTFAQCIRANGVQDFPDPAPDEPLVDTKRIPSAARTGGMSRLAAAMQKCRALAANAGVTGGR